MKRIAALLLCITVLLGTAACSFSVTVNETGGTATTTTLPTSFEEFKTQWADTVTTTVHEDGSIGVGVTTTTEAAVTTVSTTEDTLPTTTKPVFVRPTKPTNPKVSVIVTPTTVKPAPIPTVRRTTTTRVATTTTARPTTVTTTTRRQTVVTDGGQVTTATTTTTRATTTTTTVPTTTTTTRPAPSYTTGQTHTPLPDTQRYYYSLLDDHWKAAYRKVGEAVQNLEERVEFDFNISENRGYYIVNLYMADHPEIFYLTGSGSIYNHGDGTSSYAFCYAVGKNDGEYCRYGSPLTDELRQKIRQKKAIFDAEVNRIVSTIPANIPQVEKERLIYDRILKDSFYNLGAQWDGLAEDNWTAYGILVNKYGVCESYAEAFQTLCLAVGINCVGIVGSAGGGHKWNAVQLDGDWYQCDITFDDPIGGEEGAAYHYYFNRTDAEMRELDHVWTQEYDGNDLPAPDCNGTKYSYKNYFGGSLW